MDPKMTAVDAAECLGITTQAINKKLKTKGLPFKKSQNRVFFGHEAAKEIFAGTISKPPKYQVITFEIVKGGVGKSSIAVSCAVRASLYGLRVLCVDTDPQGNLTQAFGVNPANTPVLIDVLSEKLNITDSIVNVNPGIDIVPSRIENSMLDNTLMLKRFPLDKVYKQMLSKLRKQYDIIFIDCPPSLGQSVAAAALASDLVIAPVAPESFCLSGLKITVDELINLEASYAVSIPVKILLNKYDSRTKLSHEVLKLLLNSEQYQDKMFQCYVRTSQDFANYAADRESIFDVIKPTSAKEDVDIFVRELVGVTPKDKAKPNVSLSTDNADIATAL